MQDIINYYGLELKRVGDYLRGCCPLHGGDDPLGFIVDVEGDKWFCFHKSHQVGGNFYAGGGAVQYLMYHLCGVSFMEAVEWGRENILKIKKK